MKKKKLSTLTVLLSFLLLSIGIVSLKPVAAQADSYTFKSNGKTFREKINYSSGMALYQKKAGRYKKVAKCPKWAHYRFSYGKKLYFSGGEGGPGYTYTYTIGKKKFKFEKSISLLDHRGKYAIGHINAPGDPSPGDMCLYNLSTKKITKLGRGCNIHFIGNIIYYAYACNQHSSTQTTMQVIRRNVNGSGKKVIKTFRIKGGTSYMYVLSPHKVKYLSKYGWKTLTF